MGRLLGAAVLVTLCAVVYETFLASRIRRALWQVIGRTFLVLTSGYASYLFGQFLSRGERAEAAERHKQTLSMIESSKWEDSKDSRELNVLRYRDIFRSSEQDARKWVRDFLNAPPHGELAAASSKSREIAHGLWLRWQPLYDFIVSQFDSCVDELRQGGKAEVVKQHDLSLIFIDDFRNIDEQFRRVKFPNGHSVFLRLMPAKIEGGSGFSVSATGSGRIHRRSVQRLRLRSQLS